MFGLTGDDSYLIYELRDGSYCKGREAVEHVCFSYQGGVTSCCGAMIPKRRTSPGVGVDFFFMAVRCNKSE